MHSSSSTETTARSTGTAATETYFAIEHQLRKLAVNAYVQCITALHCGLESAVCQCGFVEEMLTVHITKA
eukprot:5730-Heterococcus_DN1.PRE.8